MTPLATMVRRPSPEFGRRVASPLLDVLIHAALIGAMAVLCYEVLAPFRALILWALILAVSIYPFQQALARRLGGRQAVAATIVVISGSVLILAPTLLLVNSVGHSLQDLVRALRERGVPVIIISENLQEVFAVADRIVVMRRGRKVGERAIGETNDNEIVSLIVGAEEIKQT